MHKFLYPDQFTEKIREKRANIMCSRGRFLDRYFDDIETRTVRVGPSRSGATGSMMINFSIKTSKMLGEMRDEFFINPYYQ